MRRSHGHEFAGVLLVAFIVAGCATRDGVLERSYATNEHVAATPSVRMELVRAAYLPRGVEFEVLVENLGEDALALERQGILLAYHGLEYPLDLVAADRAKSRARDPVAEEDVPERIELAQGDSRMLLLEFRLGRAMTETGWIVLRGLSDKRAYAEPLWLEVPPSPSRASRPGSRNKSPRGSGK